MVARSSRASLRAFTATSSREIIGLAVLEVTARDVRVEQVQQGHSLVYEIVRQTPLSREDIERDALQEFADVFRLGHHLLVHLGRKALRALGGPVANAAPVGIHKLAQGVLPGVLVR